MTCFLSPVILCHGQDRRESSDRPNPPNKRHCFIVGGNCLHGPGGIGVWEFVPRVVLSQCLCASFTDERDRVQKKTFTKWVNKHLMKVGGCSSTSGCFNLGLSAPFSQIGQTACPGLKLLEIQVTFYFYF